MSRPTGQVELLDLEPAVADFREQAVAGLVSSPRTLPSKFFYDERGSELFGLICELPEYHITRTELAILVQHGAEMAESIGENAELVGFGTGAGVKTRMLLEHLRNPIAYVPVDISRQRLIDSAIELSTAMPDLEVLPVCADYLQALRLPTPRRKPEHVAVYFPGSTIGNLKPESAREFLRSVCALCGTSGGLIIGVDLRKPRAVVEAAYNDSAGVTAEFNRNLLVRANRELGANFDVPCWQHRAVYNEEHGRIEMHLVSQRDQTVQIDEQPFSFKAGEHIITEFSYKFTIDGFTDLAATAGFRRSQVWTDREQVFAVFHFVVAD